MKPSEKAYQSMGKGENAGNQHFLLFLQCFQKPSLFRSFKLSIVCKGLTLTKSKMGKNDKGYCVSSAITGFKTELTFNLNLVFFDWF